MADLQKQLHNVTILPETENGQTETIDLALYEKKSSYKGVDKVTHYWTNAEFGSHEAGSIRLYVPLMGAKGYTPSDEDVRALFNGELVHGTGLISKNGKEYEADFKFDPYKKGFAKANYTGACEPQFG